jgi:hypothetical protein
MAGLASIFHSKFIQEILVSDWIIRSAHAQTDCLQMRSPALSKWQDLALYCLYLRAFRVTKPTFYSSYEYGNQRVWKPNVILI